MLLSSTIVWTVNMTSGHGTQHTARVATRVALIARCSSDHKNPAAAMTMTDRDFDFRLQLRLLTPAWQSCLTIEHGMAETTRTVKAGGETMPMWPHVLPRCEPMQKLRHVE